MEAGQILCKPIGVIYTPFNVIHDMPIQPSAAKGIYGHIEIFPEYMEGLNDLDGFSHISLIYHFHKIKGFQLKVKPFMDDVEHGIFATKSPKRPNAIGFSTVKLLFVEGNILHIEMVDMLNGTPLLDIKPFFSKFDNRANTLSGWLDKHNDFSLINLRSDERFK